MMPKRQKMPLFPGESEWVNVTIECDECGDSIVSFQVAELVNEQPDFSCPLCGQLTGQKTVVEMNG